MSMRILRNLLLTALVGYWITMMLLTHLPRVPAVGGVTDKTAHFIGFALLGALLYLAIWAAGRATPWTSLLVLVVLGIYAAVDEITQPLTGRHASFLDWQADMAGAATAVMVLGAAHWATARRRRRSGGERG
jgi:VanZ family protein